MQTLTLSAQIVSTSSGRFPTVYPSTVHPTQTGSNTSHSSSSLFISSSSLANTDGIADSLHNGRPPLKKRASPGTTKDKTQPPSALAPTLSSSSSLPLSSSQSLSLPKQQQQQPLISVQAETSVKPRLLDGLGSAGDERLKAYRVLFEDEYRDEVKLYMHQMERSTMPNLGLMDAQPELKWYMRPYLVEFLVEIHQQFRLRPEVLYLALNIVDRYVSKRIVFKKHYQLVGCAALWIAAKFEDSKDKVPLVEQLREMCCNAYDESAFLQMEGHVLSTIGWVVGHPTAESWLRLACLGTSQEDAETQHVTRFIMELSLFHKEFCSFVPSAIASGALLLARWILRKPLSVPDPKSPTVQVAFHLDVHFGGHLASVSDVLISKYSHFYYNQASLLVRHEYLRGRRFSLPVPATMAATVVEPRALASTLPGQMPLPTITVPTTPNSSPTHSIIPPLPSLSRGTPVMSTIGMRRSSSNWSSDSDMPPTPTGCIMTAMTAITPDLAKGGPTDGQKQSVVSSLQVIKEQQTFVVGEPRIPLGSLNAAAISSSEIGATRTRSG
ncbi:Cyclin B and related kinase-activating proteins [Phaffia rhodozyma]|uniref:Cyclin B and related kinase-activating proteins n=1 Tax=Phaffia rhodozyma TaxID=264483 RepID=A0A0F7SEP3_PHARH|nr:Cyclin B and related kinase-activating proteins [Phaffia rhodozyma]